ncbi:hypothetical protein SCA6_008475 [Theobroma cacao]
MGWRESMAAEGDDKTGGDAGKSKGGRRLGRIGRGSRDEERRGRDGVKSCHRMWPLAARSATVLAYHFNDRKRIYVIILIIFKKKLSTSIIERMATNGRCITVKCKGSESVSWLFRLVFKFLFRRVHLVLKPWRGLPPGSSSLFRAPLSPSFDRHSKSMPKRYIILLT